MSQKPFWLSEMDVRGSQRISKDILEKFFNKNEILNMPYLLKTSPGWAGIAYLNSFKDNCDLSKRDYLLGWVFSTIEKQDGFAIEIAVKGLEKFEDKIFEKLKNYSITRIKQSYKKSPHKVEKSLLKRFIGYLIKTN